MTENPRIILIANIDRLTDKDQRFAYSLLGARNPTANQLHWIGVMAERATKPVEPGPVEQVPNVKALVDLLQRPASKLKYPKISFRVGDQELRLQVAGHKSQTPGAVNATGARDGIWHGRIHTDGRWEPTRNAHIARHGGPVLDALRAFAADPEKVAREYGRLTGLCCFCSHDLTDEVSVALGYGPTCAKNYGLPHNMATLKAA